MLIRGALLGLMLDLLNIPMLVIVPVFALFGYYPWWMITPGDEYSQFGANEPGMVAIYSRYGRWIGDVQWLAFRNCLYGLAYWLKPAEFKRITNYGLAYSTSCEMRGWYTLWRVGPWSQIEIAIGPFDFLAGWQCKPVVIDPGDNRVPPNPTMRPICSIRTRK